MTMPKISFLKLRKIFVVVFVALGIFSAGYILGAKGFRAQIEESKKIILVRELPADKAKVDFSLFWKVWDTLEARYFDTSKIDEKKMVYGAIGGMVQALGDPYTVFLPPEDNKVTNEDLSGSFEGVGIQIGFRGSQLVVIAPLPGSPAEKAGVKAGDAIVGIKDTANNVDQGTAGISLPEAVKVIRGKAGTKVTLFLTRDGMEKIFETEVTRAKIDVPSVILSWVGEDKNLARLQLLKFGSETNTEWDQKVAAIVANKNTRGIILDVRNNPGGYLEQAVDLAGEFLKIGAVVTIEEKADGTKNDFKTSRIGRLTKTPLVVLINGGSASAAEILAGALRDYDRAKLVGEKTFGKGSIQEPLELEGGNGLHITVARWLTPKGIWVNEKGLEPDFKIVPDETGKEDNQLQAAIKLLE